MASKTPTPQPKEAFAEPTIAGPDTGYAPADSATLSVQEAHDTQNLWESAESHEVSGTTGAHGGVRGGYPCDNGAATRQRL